MITYSKTYTKVTPESAEIGDYSEIGHEVKPEKISLRDLIREVNNTSVLHVEDFAGSLSLYCEAFTSDYRTGETTEYCHHIKANKRKLNRIKKVLGIS